MYHNAVSCILLEDKKTRGTTTTGTDRIDVLYHNAVSCILLEDMKTRGTTDDVRSML